MDPLAAPLLDRILTWPRPAQEAALACRALFHGVAEARAIGPLEESLKWGQPAWRPVRPRTGSTLRLGWSEGQPDRLSLFVDCKTDLALRLKVTHPDLPFNDERRHIAVSLDTPLPEEAVIRLAEMTFCYHLRQQTAPTLG